MKRNQALWLMLTAVVLYFGAVYCEDLIRIVHLRAEPWFDGNPLPPISELALNASSLVANHGTWAAILLVLLAAASFWCNRNPNALEGRQLQFLNAVGYYVARGVLIGLVLVAILQSHGLQAISLNVDWKIRKELGKSVPELERMGR